MDDNGAGPRRTLDLDELFGSKKTVAIQWQGKKHTLRHPENITPHDLVRIQDLETVRGEILALDPEVLTDEQADLLDEALTELLLLLDFQPAKEKDFPFLGKVRVMDFYLKETGMQVEAAEAPKESPPTGG